MKPGDRVAVADFNLSQLRNIMFEATGKHVPNHHGTIETVYENGDLLIVFDDGGASPWPAAQCSLLAE